MSDLSREGKTRTPVQRETDAHSFLDIAFDLAAATVAAVAATAPRAFALFAHNLTHTSSGCRSGCCRTGAAFGAHSLVVRT